MEAPGDLFFDTDPSEAFPLALLQTLVSPTLEAVTVEAIKHSATPAAVYRLRLDYGSGAAGLPPTLIAKRTAPNWTDDAAGHRREYEFYRQWAGRLGDALPHVTYAGPEPDTDFGLILLEDVAASHHFSPTDHLWRPDELSQALRAYAQLHVRGAALIDHDQPLDWLFPRYEDRVIARAAELPAMVSSLAGQGKLRPLRGFDPLVAWALGAIDTYKALPATLLHNDVAPQNIGLPRRGIGRVAGGAGGLGNGGVGSGRNGSGLPVHAALRQYETGRSRGHARPVLAGAAAAGGCGASGRRTPLPAAVGRRPVYPVAHPGGLGAQPTELSRRLSAACLLGQHVRRSG